MSIQLLVIFGLVAGIAANFINPHIARSSLFGAILLGITGSVIGGILANLIGTTLQVPSQNMLTTLLAVSGCMVLLTVQKLVRESNV